MADHKREFLQQIEGSPQPTLSIEEIGRAIGVEGAALDELVSELEREGHLRRDGDRVIAVGTDG
jgi:DNA-binding IclR family transcriptional regulator